MRRRIYREQFERCAGARHEVVLRAGGHDDDVAGGNSPSIALLLSSPFLRDAWYGSCTVKNFPEARDQEPCKTSSILAHGGTEDDASEVPTLPRPLPLRERFFLGWGPRVV